MSVEDIFQTMRELVAEQFSLEPEEVSMETSFEDDLWTWWSWSWPWKRSSNWA